MFVEIYSFLKEKDQIIQQNNSLKIQKKANRNDKASL